MATQHLPHTRTHVVRAVGARSAGFGWTGAGYAGAPCPTDVRERPHMTTTIRPTAVPTPAPHRTPRGTAFLRLFHTTDHKQIGVLYLATSFAFFLAGGFMALLMRAE